MFYFEQLLQTALNGIDSKGIMQAVLQIAGTILILSLLYAVYQAFTSGGDVRLLAVAGAKYLILGLIFLQYGTVFRGINTMFNSVADFIYSQSGIGDVIGTWLNQLGNYVTTNGFSSFWGLVTGSIVGFLTVILILVGLIILPISYTLFTLFYAMYGSVLYVVGPFVLALLPARGIGQLARTYAVQHEQCSECERHSERICRLDPNDPPRSHQHSILGLDCFDSSNCQPSRTRGRWFGGHGHDERRLHGQSGCGCCCSCRDRRRSGRCSSSRWRWWWDSRRRWGRCTTQLHECAARIWRHLSECSSFRIGKCTGHGRRIFGRVASTEPTRGRYCGSRTPAWFFSYEFAL